jgi:hypothetical protein
VKIFGRVSEWGRPRRHGFRCGIPPIEERTKTMKTILSMTALAIISAGPAAAAPYTLFIYETSDQLALRAADQPATAAYWEAYDVFGKSLAAAGVLRGGSALTTGAPVSQVSAGDPVAATAPYAASALALGGYFQIEVPTEADAIAWARKMPVVDGVIEVRAGYPVPGMAM